MAVQESETKIHVDYPETINGSSHQLRSSRRGCFWFPCFGGRGPSPSAAAAGLVWWERISSVHQGDLRWWARGVIAFRKVREWSEIVAGPRWKTFIRRLNRNRAAASASGSGNGKFQYDPLSYSLNFDEGPGYYGNLAEDDFSPRYAVGPGQTVHALPIIAESSRSSAVLAN